jgi:Zn-dependent protease with chaperone function
MTAALAPAFGWIADHCNTAGDAHAHPHICGHHESAWPAVPVLLLAAFSSARAAITSWRLLYLAAFALSTQRKLLREADPKSPGGLHVLPLEAPQAFVLGTIRPRVFVTRGLLTADNEQHLESVLAHERAHLARADALRRLLASIASPFQLPGIARGIERQLARAHEMAADEDAARSVGSRASVARALLHLARVKTNSLQPALAFGGSDVEVRVRALLASPHRNHGPSAKSILVTGATGLAAIALGAETVHHGLEVMLGLLG